MADRLEWLARNRQRYVEELCELVRIPSVSSLPARQDDVRRAAEWIRDRLAHAGMDAAALMETGAQPAVYAEHLHARGKPTVLIYGHFDVQPAAHEDCWSADPFHPVIRDGRVYGRGSSDDKGNLLIPVQAIEAMLSTAGQLPVNVKVLVEGQEEIGSPTMAAFVETHASQLACDVAVSADGSQWSETEPALWLSLRGLCSLQIDVSGPGQDMHSGTYGGSIHNPIHALVRVLDSMRADDGLILVDGFYDEVRALTADERSEIARVPFDKPSFLAATGAAGLFGEPGFTTRERQWRRPTLEINGIWGGFQGEGVKTVLPSTAHAKITCRLVNAQQPDAVREAIVRHVVAHIHPAAHAEVRSLGSSGMPYSIQREHVGNIAAAGVLTRLYGAAPFAVASGGSIPILRMFEEHLGVKTVIFAFALNDEGAHGPDEFFRMSSYERGRAAYCELFDRLADAA